LGKNKAIQTLSADMLLVYSVHTNTVEFEGI
jgi:hypothetical protein